MKVTRGGDDHSDGGGDDDDGEEFWQKTFCKRYCGRRSKVVRKPPPCGISLQSALICQFRVCVVFPSTTSMEEEEEEEKASVPLGNKSASSQNEPPQERRAAPAELSCLGGLMTAVDGKGEHDGDGEGDGNECWGKSVCKPHCARCPEVEGKPPLWPSFLHYYLRGQRQRTTYIRHTASAVLPTTTSEEEKEEGAAVFIAPKVDESRREAFAVVATSSPAAEWLVPRSHFSR
ncbi:unnamed protein product [Taenia asiatica]|uniref:Uncharacterized protein n=1 Tax=Taenia asiatica TaxID=60517 RepID=A0A0R3WDY1_TAEAS|nr:unnamed protein product [Taenia asiatica]